MMYYGQGLSTPFMVIGHAFSILIWIFVIIMILKLVKRRGTGHWEGWGSHKSAMGILRERFAKGEISKDEYEERKRVLESK
jgi:putative membrane protein